MNVEQQPLMHPAHTRIWELLPWYLNGTLDRDELEAALKGDERL